MIYFIMHNVDLEMSGETHFLQCIALQPFIQANKLPDAVM